MLSGVEVKPTTITPNADGKDDVARIAYTLNRSATLSIYFVGADGKKHYFRRDKPRSPGSYETLFGGAVEGQVLPDGVYTYVVEAAAEGVVEKVEGRLTITGSDRALPELQNFTVFPNTFTPNQDGINDRVSISYFLPKPAEVRVFVADAKGNEYPVAEKKTGVKPGEVGIHQYDYDGGVDLGAMPPPDGTYKVIAEAVDEVGNQVVQEAPLTISEGGVPRGEIVNATAEFRPTIVPLGSTLTFTVTVANLGTVPIRTKGPEPGTTYTTSENFNTLGFYEEPGIFRIGVDFEGNSQGRKYPYRWQIGKTSELTKRVIDGKEYLYLMPGKKATITGHIRITDKPPRPVVFYWVGLVHEDVRIVNDYIQPTRISIGF